MRDIRDAVERRQAPARARQGGERRAGSLIAHGGPQRRRRRRSAPPVSPPCRSDRRRHLRPDRARRDRPRQRLGPGLRPGGSGTEGWPLCNGEAIPFFHDTEVIIEFSHRAARRGGDRPDCAARLDAPTAHLRELRWPLRTSIAAGVLVLVQAGLGGLTVEKNLDEELVAAHLGLAMVLIGLVLWIAVRARAELAARGARARRSRGAPAGPRPEAVRRRGRGAAALRDRRRRLRGRHRGGGRQRHGPQRQRAPTSPAASSSRAASTRASRHSARAGSPTSTSPTASSSTAPRSRSCC